MVPVDGMRVPQGIGVLGGGLAPGAVLVEGGRRGRLSVRRSGQAGILDLHGARAPGPTVGAW